MVESSVPYRVSDERKVSRYLERPYVQSIRAMFESTGLSWITLAVGLSLADEHRVRSSELRVFVVAESLEVAVCREGTRHPISSA